MTVKEIVLKYLVDNGYSGLLDSESGCDCGLEELFECCDGGNVCDVGYKIPCICGKGHEYDISPDKPIEDGK